MSPLNGTTTSNTEAQAANAEQATLAAAVLKADTEKAGAALKTQTTTERLAAANKRMIDAIAEQEEGPGRGDRGTRGAAGAGRGGRGGRGGRQRGEGAGMEA